jgi:ATP-dependent Lhr-like helicase
LALKKCLLRTWDAFFSRHGNFTAAQLAAIPALLEGANIILCAPTASGKTEAVLAPLIERHCPVTPGADGLSILYLTPTRALANDLLRRLSLSLEILRLGLAVKTRDLNTFDPANPAPVLITTPESTDSLLTSQARVFANLRAIILDELHLFDGTPRGDHLRMVLRRLHRLREYAAAQGDAPDAVSQYAALSASIPNPEATAARYFPGGQVIRIAGQRAIEAEHVSLSPESANGLTDFLETFQERGWHKALVFCNTRADVEAYAAALRGRSPFGGAIYVHYSNLEAQRRREIEAGFASAEAAICFASSTLELGIDIGSIDAVLLIGPPGSVGSFVQRIGRGNRRGDATPVVCFWRDSLERLIFETLCAQANVPTGGGATFRLSVVVQQLFSLIKQSPMGAVRFAELARLFDGLAATADLKSILGHLTQIAYLKVGRPGEWRAGPNLNALVDRQASRYNTLSLYSNIQGADRTIEIREQLTHQTIARVDAQWFDRPMLTLEGRPVSIEWADGEAVWVRSQPGMDADRLRYRSARQLLSFDLAQLLPAQLGLPPGATPCIQRADSWVCFHWLGDLYGRALFSLIRPYQPVGEATQPGICFVLHMLPDSMPELTAAIVTAHLEQNFRSYEQFMALGPFYPLLPVDLRRRSVIDQFDVLRFVAAVRTLNLQQASEAIQGRLAELIAD